MIPKSETIDAIQRFNPSAEPSFLADFSSEELTRYLERLRVSAPVRPRPPVRDTIDRSATPSTPPSAARRAG